MLKVKTEQEGKSFEAHVKMLITDGQDIVGMGIAGNTSSCRAIHASLYVSGHQFLNFFDDEMNNKFNRWSTKSYRRIETVNGKVNHSFFLPRMAMEEDYEKALQEAEQNEEAKPERIIIAPSEEIEHEIGMFLATTYGLPRTKEWVERYFSFLPRDKWDEYHVVTTELMDGEWSNVRAIKIGSMQEDDVLGYIEIAIRSGVLNPNTSIGSNAEFHEGMTTEEYLRQNAETLASHIDRYMKPQYDGMHYERAMGETKRVNLPAQARTAMGALEVLKRQGSTFLVGDLGSGSVQRS